MSDSDIPQTFNAAAMYTSQGRHLSLECLGKIQWEVDQIFCQYLTSLMHTQTTWFKCEANNLTQLPVLVSHLCYL